LPCEAFENTTRKCRFIGLSLPLQLLHFNGQLDLDFNIQYDVEEMSASASLGEFEQVVLLAILRLGDEAYGVSIRSEIAACTGRDPSTGALYTTLDRLETKALVLSRTGDPTPQRGGRAKRYYIVTKAGLAAVARAQRSYQRLLVGITLPGDANA
jgi:PadR family transcriptional regulator, regulatory protein PadR